MALPPPAERMLDYLPLLRSCAEQRGQLSAWARNPSYLARSASVEIAHGPLNRERCIMTAARLIRAAELLDAQAEADSARAG